MRKPPKGGEHSAKTPPKGKKGLISPQLLRQKLAMKGVSFKIVCREKRLNKFGLAPLFLQYFISGVKGELGLDLHIPPKYWIDSSQQINAKGNPLYDNYNLLIEQARTDFNSVLIELALQKITPTKALIKSLLESKNSREDFMVYFEQKFLERWDKNQIEENTKKNHKAVFNKCKLYKSQWFFNEIDTLFMKNFDTWHMAHMKSKIDDDRKRLQKNNGINTGQKALTIIKSYLHLALKDEKIKFAMPTIPVRYMETSREFLTSTELKIMVDKYNTDYFEFDPELESALEKFLFSCGTGLRISDIKKICTENVSNGCLNFTPFKGRKKSVKEINIPVMGFIKKIVDKRVGLVFGDFSEPVVNRNLKIVASACGINKSLSMNVGRHTFATLFLQTGGDIKSLMELLGHSNIRTTQNYLHKDLDHLKRQMEKGMSALFE